MKHLLLISGLFLLTVSLKAQTFTLTPGKTDTVDAPFNTITIFDIYQNNITSSKILFKWTKVSMVLPSGWDYSMCDYTHCYTGLPASATMDSVNVGSMGFLGLNINPYAIAGQGIVKIYVYDAAFPTGGDTLTWVVNASTVGVEEVSSVWNQISVYPNPTGNYLTISNIPESCTMFIYSETGKLIEQHPVTSSQLSFDLSNYTNGIYSITLVGNNKILNRRKIIVQK